MTVELIMLFRHLHSQFAFSGARIFNVSILLRPCEVSRMTCGSTPISLPMLCVSGDHVSQIMEGEVRASVSHLNQCFSIAFVESIMVPSISNKKPWKEACVGGAEKDMAVIEAEQELYNN